jgi:hypothetical protein
MPGTRSEAGRLLNKNRSGPMAHDGLLMKHTHKETNASLRC